MPADRRIDAITDFLAARVVELTAAGGVQKRLGAAIGELIEGPVDSDPYAIEWDCIVELFASAWYDHPDYDEDWLPYE